MMENSSTRLEFAVLNHKKPENQIWVDFCKANKKLCTIIVLGQGKSHSMALLGKTKNDEFPNGKTWEFIEKTKTGQQALRCKRYD
jgi:hypothetical protein